MGIIWVGARTRRRSTCPSCFRADCSELLMCGRIALTSSREVLADQFGIAKFVSNNLRS